MVIKDYRPFSRIRRTMKHFTDRQGFTLIEIIAVLVILSIVAIFSGNTILHGMQGYIFARNTDAVSQKAQLAMARIKLELTNASDVSLASADQIDFTLPRSALPSCTLDDGCQYSLKRTGAQITLEKTTAPAITPQVLIDGLTTNNGGLIFLSYFKADGASWATADGFSNLTRIKVQLSLDVVKGGIPFLCEGSINPRATALPNAPLLN